MMIDEIRKSMRETLQERATSPLSGAFLVSWLVWNFQLVLAVFSGLPIKEKLEFIDEQLYSGIWESTFYLFFGPLLTALAFLFIYPYPAKFIYRFWRRRKKELLDIRREIEEETLLTKKESAQIRRRLIDIESSYNRELETLSKENDGLKSAVADKDGELQKLKYELDDLNQLKAEYESNESRQEVGETLLKKRLLSVPWRLHFNPKLGKRGSKMMMFGPGGEIIEGSNHNENRWQIIDGSLELIQEDGLIHSRFKYIPEKQEFHHTNDKDTRSLRDQLLVPEREASEA